jgi:hypothetical protein
MEIKLSQREVNNFAEDVYRIIKEIPIYYLNEIIENAVEERKKEGEIEDIDYVSSSDEEDECEALTHSDEDHESESEGD